MTRELFIFTVAVALASIWLAGGWLLLGISDQAVWQ